MATDPTWVVRCLVAAIGGTDPEGIDAGRPAVVGLRNALIEVVASDPGATHDRLEVADDGGTGPGDAATGDPGATSDLVAIGVATVDADRFAAERGWQTVSLPPDDLLGARVATVAATPAVEPAPAVDPALAVDPPLAVDPAPAAHRRHLAPAVLLLEPNTEGRIAAALARRGEGPTALYVRSSLGVDRARAALVARGCRPTPVVQGPFGRAVAIGPAMWGPHLVLVEVDAAVGSPRTIVP